MLQLLFHVSILFLLFCHPFIYLNPLLCRVWLGSLGFYFFVYLQCQISSLCLRLFIHLLQKVLILFCVRFFLCIVIFWKSDKPRTPETQALQHIASSAKILLIHHPEGQNPFCLHRSFTLHKSTQFAWTDPSSAFLLRLWKLSEFFVCIWKLGGYGRFLFL